MAEHRRGEDGAVESVAVGRFPRARRGARVECPPSRVRVDAARALVDVTGDGARPGTRARFVRDQDGDSVGELFAEDGGFVKRRHNPAGERRPVLPRRPRRIRRVTGRMGDEGRAEAVGVFQRPSVSRRAAVLRDDGFGRAVAGSVRERDTRPDGDGVLDADRRVALR